MECSICLGMLGGRSYYQKSTLPGQGRRGEGDEAGPTSGGKDKTHKSWWSNFFAKSPDPISCTPCGHLYHTSCIKSWLKKGAPFRHCPACRKDIPNDTDLRTIYPTFLTETCVGCAELKKEFQKIEQAHVDQCRHYSKELENALGEIKKKIELTGKLTKANEEMKSRMESERVRASCETKNLQKQYDNLLAKYRDLKDKYHLLNKAQAPSHSDQDKLAPSSRDSNSDDQFIQVPEEDDCSTGNECSSSTSRTHGRPKSKWKLSNILQFFHILDSSAK